MANKIDVPGETLQDFVNRYRILSSPKLVNTIMKRVTANVDRELKLRLETLGSHPKDTGLMKKRWRLPENYLNNHTGKVWQVYLLNTATVGEQARLKANQTGMVHRKKKRVGRHNLKRYMPWVDNRTKFYTKQLRVIKNKIQPIFKEEIILSIAYIHNYRPELFNAQENQNLAEDTGRG